MASETIIIVIGSVTAQPETFQALLAASVAHVERSRAEEGCLSHHVYRSAETPLRLDFIERWADRESLDAHFARPGSHEFVAAVRTLAAEPGGMQIYHAIPVA